jgi:hypothetical protein
MKARTRTRANATGAREPSSTIVKRIVADSTGAATDSRVSVSGVVVNAATPDSAFGADEALAAFLDAAASVNPT